MGALKGTGVFMKKWQKILIGVIVVCVALIAANGLTMKGFCYTLSYPGGEMIFMEKGHCYVGLPGSKKSEELSGVAIPADRRSCQTPRMYRILIKLFCGHLFPWIREDGLVSIF